MQTFPIRRERISGFSAHLFTGYRTGTGLQQRVLFRIFTGFPFKPDAHIRVRHRKADKNKNL